MYLLIATRNPNKFREIQADINMRNLILGSALDYPDLPDVVEDGDTLEANAIKKSVTLAKQTGRWALADDTGLEVNALDGAPGVYSARYAGEQATSTNNVTKLLQELANRSDRTARFRTVLALSDPRGHARWVDGICDGTITKEARGSHGFGYDPVFLPKGFTETFAEMDIMMKNKISHRGRAIQSAKETWEHILQSKSPTWSQTEDQPPQQTDRKQSRRPD